MVGTEWKSASRLPGVTLARIMPTPPARLTALLFSTRSLTPRSQTTILPSTLSGSRLPRKHSAAASSSASPAAARVELISLVCGSFCWEIEAPRIRLPLPRTTVFSKLWWVEAATVVSQGLLCATVDSPGPALPAEVATKMPASAAPSKAISTGSMTVSVTPEMEKLMTSTPSATASSMASRIEEVKQSPVSSSLSSKQTLYAAILAAGAMPDTSPKRTSSVFTPATALPADVLAVCVPCPSPSRVDRTSSGERSEGATVSRKVLG